jgi:NAD(P)-dependent dehydrogenase (short-subunit alcohol dehydrogenase family)
MKQNLPLAKLISLRGKTAILTGAAAGIGRAIATRFGEAGANLEIVDIDIKGLKNLARELSGLNITINLHQYDMSIKENITTLWQKWQENPPDILVNNVGIYPPQDFLTFGDSVWQKVMDTNLNSTQYMCRYMLNARGDKGGVIINMGSIEAILPFADDLIHYDVSKAGIIALTRGLAKEYGKKGFKINAILPGGIDTPGTRAVAARILTKFDVGLIPSGIKYQTRIPVGRRGKPDEVACIALFLACGLSSYVQGALIPADGGFLSS